MKSQRYLLWVTPILGITAAGCLPDLTADPGDPNAQPPTVTATADGLTWSIDATSEEAWVGVDFLEGAIVSEQTGQLDFMRFNVRMSKGWEAAWAEGSDLNQAPPQTGWVIDLPDQDMDRLPEYALEEWYDYDFGTHEVTPKDRVWFFRAHQSAPSDTGFNADNLPDNPFEGVIKLRIDSYYDDAGTSAVFQVVSVIDAPS